MLQHICIYSIYIYINHIYIYSYTMYILNTSEGA